MDEGAASPVFGCFTTLDSSETIETFNRIWHEICGRTYEMQKLTVQDR